MSKPKLILLELNEITFPWLESYIRAGYLPEFAKLFGTYSVCTTSSEEDYDHWEPWIQWVSIHTGKTFAEHGIFRLGDIQNLKSEQIWDFLEKPEARNRFEIELK